MADVQTQNASIAAHAHARHVRMSPQKARLVMDLIRGQKAQDALQTLKYTPKRAAKHIEKVLRSAIANAELKAENSGAPLDVDQLFVAQCFVNEGPRWKRLRPAPMGRAFRYQKRTSHIVVASSSEAPASSALRSTSKKCCASRSPMPSVRPQRLQPYARHWRSRCAALFRCRAPRALGCTAGPAATFRRAGLGSGQSPASPSAVTSECAAPWRGPQLLV